MRTSNRCRRSNLLITGFDGSVAEHSSLVRHRHPSPLQGRLTGDLAAILVEVGEISLLDVNTSLSESTAMSIVHVSGARLAKDVLVDLPRERRVIFVHRRLVAQSPDEIRRFGGRQWSPPCKPCRSVVMLPWGRVGGERERESSDAHPRRFPTFSPCSPTIDGRQTGLRESGWSPQPISLLFGQPGRRGRWASARKTPSPFAADIGSQLLRRTRFSQLLKKEKSPWTWNERQTILHKTIRETDERMILRRSTSRKSDCIRGALRRHGSEGDETHPRCSTSMAPKSHQDRGVNPCVGNPAEESSRLSLSSDPSEKDERQSLATEWKKGLEGEATIVHRPV